MRIAIIGSGISGNFAAYMLHQQHDVTVFEKNDRPGGHSATVDIRLPNGQTLPVDTGFIVYNELNYPGLTRLFDELNVETQMSDMSFAFSSASDDLEWSGQSLSSVFAQKKNLLRPKFWRMLADILRFNKHAAALFETENLPRQPLGKWLDEHNYSNAFRVQYLYPMAAAIWSSPSFEIAAFPAGNLIQFFYNHRLINRDRPQWRTVAGGSREYVKKLTAPFASDLRLNARIEAVERDKHGIRLYESGNELKFDKVIFATHSDEALSLLGDYATDLEKEALAAIRYAPNDVYLHRDPDLMPRRRETWSSWNYMSPANSQTDKGPVFVSYWMNRLQNLPTDEPIIVSLNPDRPPRESHTFFHTRYDHPQFDTAAIAAQRQFSRLQGMYHTYYCGAWLGYGFHEDGLQSALRICQALGVEWTTDEFLRAAQ